VIAHLRCGMLMTFDLPAFSWASVPWPASAGPCSGPSLPPRWSTSRCPAPWPGRQFALDELKRSGCLGSTAGGWVIKHRGQGAVLCEATCMLIAAVAGIDGSGPNPRARSAPTTCRNDRAPS